MVDTINKYLPAITNGSQIETSTKTGDYTLTSSDESIVCNSSSAFTVTLPAASGSGQTYSIKNINTGVITVEGDGVETIDGQANETLYQYECMQLVDYASGKWVII